ncbi:hypothetical protein LLG46_06455 [bacterium]|nr:hypothetical protein [bacterium]
MERSLFVITLLALLALASVPTYGANVSSNFDDGTMQGWIAVGDVAAVSNPGTGGNPEGYLRMVDEVIGDVCWVVAPAQYLGNWHNKVALSADLTQESFSGTQFMTVEFRISGPGGVYKRVFSERPPLGLWRTYGTALDESLWQCVSGSWDALLDDVTELRMSIEFITGSETNGLDNVSLIESHTPTTIGLAKQMADGTGVEVPGVVTRLLDDAMYMQSADRSAGIRVKNSFALQEGDAVTIIGTLNTQYGERVLENATVISQESGDIPKPLGLCSLVEPGGIGATPVDPPLGTSLTLKETGLLVKAYGFTSDIDESNSSFVLSYAGKSVTAKLDMGALLPAPGSLTTVTGISSSDGQVEPNPMIIAGRDVPLQFGQNLIVNAGAEMGLGGNGEVIRPIYGWTPTSNFTVVVYPNAVSTSEAERIGGGLNFFHGGKNTSGSQASQTIDLSSFASSIDAAEVTASLSAYMAGYATQGDNGKVVVTFKDAEENSLGEFQIGPQAGSNQIWIFHENTQTVPVNTRGAEVKMIAIRTEGSNCDAYFDKLSLVLTQSP